jgi:hypothetical protein
MKQGVAVGAACTARAPSNAPHGAAASVAARFAPLPQPVVQALVEVRRHVLQRLEVAALERLQLLKHVIFRQLGQLSQDLREQGVGEGLVPYSYDS